MEEGFYEVDVKSLKVITLYQDGNINRKSGEMAQYTFSEGFESRWIRFVANTDCDATTILNYN